MALSRQQDYWIHPNALSITLNYFGDPQLIQTSMLAGAVILAYEKNVIAYDAAHNFREWQLQAYPTQLTDTCKYYVHAELSRTGHTAMVIYSPTKRDLEGRTFIGGAWDTTTSDTSWFIYLGEISASVDANGATVERVWTDGLHTGTLATDQHRMEEAQGEWTQMFQLNSATGLIDFLKTVSSAVFNKLTIAKEFIFGGKTLTTVAGTTDTQDQSIVNDAALPTTGYVAKEIAALDEHFLIKNGEAAQEVGGDVTFKNNVAVAGAHSVGGDSTIGGDNTIAGNQTISGTQEVKGVQTLHGGFTTPDFIQQGDIIQGAQVDKDGNAAFASITAPVMQIYELQYNRKTAVQEEFIFSDGDTVETVTYVQTDGTEIDSTAYNGEVYSYIRLGVRKQYEGYMTTFKDEDILYSNVNIIGESGQPATTGKCWLRVLPENNDCNVPPIGPDGLTINVILYSDAQCPGGVNMAPTPHMIISRHGNANGAKYPNRQTVFIISAAGENMVTLRGIDSPIIPSEGAYGVVVGKLPQTLLDYVRRYAEYVSENEPYIYARGIIVQDIIRLDYQGMPVKTENYRGQWSLAIAKGEVQGESRYVSTSSTYDTVTHHGSLWACQQSGTTVEPNDATTEWLKKVAKGDSSWEIYKLKPSVNIIYYRPETGLSVNMIDVVVEEQSENGTLDITEQSVLDSKGLRVEWSIDGKGERHILNISPSAAIELEDGSGVIATEEGDGLYLEGEELDISKIEDNITLYLVNDNDVEQASYIIPVVKDAEIEFKSIVFTRSNTTPSTPSSEEADVPTGEVDVEGKPITVKYNTFNNPLPAEQNDDGIFIWSDGVPQGSEKLWSTTRIFYNNPKKMANSAWSEPSDMTDTADIETMYSANEDGSGLALSYDGIIFQKDKDGKIDGDWLAEANKAGWYDEPSECPSEPKYIAVSKNKNGVWSNWQVSRIQGESVFTSVAFTRGNSTPTAPSEAVDANNRNTYQNPLPSNIDDDGNYIWHASIPDGTEKVWMTTRQFTSFSERQTNYHWSTPRGLTDTADIETIYTALDPYNPIPGGFKKGEDGITIDGEWLTAAHAVGWYDEASDCKDENETKATPKYMAVATCKNGVWSAWQIATTKGEPSITYVIVADKGTLKVGDTQILLHIIKNVGTSSSTVELSDLDEGGMYIAASLNGTDISNQVSHSEGGIFDLNIAKNDSILIQLKEGDVVKAELSMRESGGADGKDGADGEDGESPLLFGVNHPMITVLVDAATNKTLERVYVYVEAYIQCGEERVSPSYGEGWGIIENSSFISTDYSGVEEVTFYVDIPMSTLASELNDIEIQFYKGSDQSDIIGSTTIAIQKSQRGLPGPMGNAGSSYYPAGIWDGYKTYSVTKDSEGVVTDRPIVYEEPLTEGAEGTYYVLMEDTSLRQKPSVNPAVWKPMSNLGYVFTKALMAQWGRLAQAVFYGDYMFSAKGVDSNGVFSEYIEGMFTDGRLNGSFVPSFFLDLLNGGAMFGKLSEAYVRLKNTDVEADVVSLHRMNINDCHNITREAIPGNETLDGLYPSTVHPTLIVLPSAQSNDAYKWTEDGTHSTIVHEYLHTYTEAPNADQYRNSVLVVCADYRFFRPTDSDYGTTINNMYSDEEGWMVWKGRRCKFAFLTPGSMLRLRSVKTSEGHLIWMIENSSDFERLDTKIYLYRDYNDDPNTVQAEIYHSTESMAGGSYGYIIGSPMLNLYDKKSVLEYPTEWVIDSAGGVVDDIGFMRNAIFHRYW